MTRKINNVALLFVLVVFAPAFVSAQPPTSNNAVAIIPAPQLEFVGKEAYEVNGANIVRYKMSVTNRASHPDFLWAPTQHLGSCGKNESPSRTWVEIFGSPGDKRLGGFCGLRSSDDLGHLWFAVPSGEKGPPCVYIVMTDRQSGKRYTSNRVCSRLFTVVTGRLKSGGQSEAAREREAGLHELVAETHKTNQSEKRLRDKPGTSNVSVNGAMGWDSIGAIGAGNNATPDSSGPTTKLNAKMAKPDLIIRQFLFPPTNDKALRVQVVNTGQAPSGAGMGQLLQGGMKLDGAVIGRDTYVRVPALAAGAHVWLVMDFKGVLPNNVSLKSTTFKLKIVATEVGAGSDETNNEVWHKPAKRRSGNEQD